MRRRNDGGQSYGAVIGRGLRRFYVLSALVYVVLGMVFTVAAFAQNPNPFIPLPGNTTAVPSGSDDVSVMRYYEYMNKRQLGALNETYLFDVNALVTTYGIILVVIIVVYFFAYAWYARRRKNDLYPVEVYNGYITERGSGVDPFNWATYAVLLSFMTYYTVIQVLYGQLY